MTSKHHMHVMLPAKLNDWLEQQKAERGISKTMVLIQILEKAEADSKKEK